MKSLRGRAALSARNSRREHSCDAANEALGFTIVEVLIVLAIAGIILVIVFLAVPAAQRSVRNYDRKHAVDYIVSEMESYKATNSHYPIEAPSPDVDDRTGFINSLSVGPAANYRIRYTDDGPNHAYPYAGVGAPDDLNDAMDEITISPGHLCNRDGSGPGDANYPLISVGTWGTDYKGFAVFTLLEKSPMYCVDNNFERYGPWEL